MSVEEWLQSVTSGPVALQMKDMLFAQQHVDCEVCSTGGATEIATVRCVPWVAQRRLRPGGVFHGWRNGVLRPGGVFPGWRNGDCDQAECPTGGAAEYCDREECSRAAQRSLRSRVVCDEPLRCRLANAFYRRWSLTSLLGPGSDDTGNRLLR